MSADTAQITALPNPDRNGISSEIKEWDAPNGSVVWTAPGGLVMVQNIEPGELTPDQAVELSNILRSAAILAKNVEKTV